VTRWERQSLIAAVVWGAVASTVRACSTCYGDPDSAMAKGAVMGVYVMIGVVSFVLAGIAGTSLYWMQRSRRLSAAGDNTAPMTPECRDCVMLSEAKHLAGNKRDSSVSKATSE